MDHVSRGQGASRPSGSQLRAAGAAASASTFGTSAASRPRRPTPTPVGAACTTRRSRLGVRRSQPRQGGPAAPAAAAGPRVGYPSEAYESPDDYYCFYSLLGVETTASTDDIKASTCQRPL